MPMLKLLIRHAHLISYGAKIKNAPFSGIRLRDNCELKWLEFTRIRLWHKFCVGQFSGLSFLQIAVLFGD